MSVQQTLTGETRTYPYRGIVKDAYTTRDDGDESDTRLEIIVWTVKEHKPAEPIKDEDEDRLKYDKILEAALEEEGAEELSRRTGLKTYRDDRGGRAASTIRGYKQNPDRLEPVEEGGLPSEHPVKRVLRRFARSRDMGHFQDDEARDDIEVDPDEAEPIDMQALKRAFKLARSIASQAGFVFAPREGTPTAVEDNERIDHDEIRRHDRPLGETHAACMLEKPDGSVYEYEIDLDMKDLAGDAAIPPSGWS